jgi:hypothetical protein
VAPRSLLASVISGAGWGVAAMLAITAGASARTARYFSIATPHAGHCQSGAVSRGWRT